MVRYYVIGIVVGFVLRLLVGFKGTFRRGLAGEAGTGDARAVWSSLVAVHVGKYVLRCAIEGLVWPALILQGAAHLLMVMAIRVSARREAMAHEERLARIASEKRPEPEAEWRRAA